jgi:hypothetical protein
MLAVEDYGLFLDTISNFLLEAKENYKRTLFRRVGIRPTFERESADKETEMLIELDFQCVTDFYRSSG